MKRFIVFLYLLFFCTNYPCSASNPIVWTAYSADPSAHIFGSRVYVYASHDRNDAKTWDMVDYHVYSTDDLQNWRDHGVVLSLKEVSWARSSFWAPDCGFKDGRYYLYFPAKDQSGVFRIGVAVGESPVGPFKDIGHPITGAYGIDPSVYVDDNGRGYLIWAVRGSPWIAELKPNMTELAELPRQLDGITDFFEGPWIFKRQGKYYLTYPAFKVNGAHRGGHGQNYDYAVSSNIFGPYAYKGTFTQSGPGGENIHGSQVEWHGKWYCFYHDFSSSKGTPHQSYKRSIRVDEMTFAADGSIQPLVWTNDGPPQLHNLDPYASIGAGTMNSTDPPEGAHPIPADNSGPNEIVLGPIQPNSWIRYAKADFGDGARTFQAEVASTTSGGTIEVHLDEIGGPQVATCTVPYTGGWREFRTVECPASGATGVHDFVLVSRGIATNGLFTLLSFRFAR